MNYRTPIEGVFSMERGEFLQPLQVQNCSKCSAFFLSFLPHGCQVGRAHPQTAAEDCNPEKRTNFPFFQIRNLGLEPGRV